MRISLSASPDTFDWPDMTVGDLGSRAGLKPGSHLWCYPEEVNTTIRVYRRAMFSKSLVGPTKMI